MQLCRALCLSAISDGDEVDSARSYGKDSRPKTPSSSSYNTEPRPKTPLQNRPKTPTSYSYGDQRSNRSFYDSRNLHMDSQNNRSPMENHVSKFAEEVPNEHRNQSESRTDGNHVESLYERARPPTGPRMDPFRHNDVRLDSRSRPEYRDGYGYGRPSHAGAGGGDDRYGYGYAREAKPGQFRSRTPGPEMMARGGAGPDYRPEAHRPKTPTAQDMRSKTPMPTSHTYGGTDFRASGRYTPNPSMEFGRYGRATEYSRGWPDFSSPPVARRYDSFENPAHNRSYGGELARTMMGPPPPSALGQNSPRGAGHPVRQSTSFEAEDPVPGNLTRMPKRSPPQSGGGGFPPPGSAGHSPRSQSRGPVDEGDGMIEFTVQLHRQESGYGFRIIGGTEEGSQVSRDVLLLGCAFLCALFFCLSVYGLVFLLPVSSYFCLFLLTSACFLFCLFHLTSASFILLLPVPSSASFILLLPVSSSACFILPLSVVVLVGVLCCWSVFIVAP